MINNGSLHYDHDTDGLSTLIAGCHAPVRGRTTETLIGILYRNNRLTVSTDIDGANAWTECFSIDQVYLPLGYFFGFTAATGELTDNHDITSVHMYRLDDNQGAERSVRRRDILPSGPPPTLKSETEERMKSSIWSTVKLVVKIFFALLLTAVLLISAFFYWRSRQRARRFRY